MRFLEITTALLLMLVLYATWPPNEEHINVVLRYKAEAGALPLQVYLQAGKDKHARGVMQAGDRERWLIIPDRAVVRADERVLRLQYHPLDQAGMHGLGWHYSEDGAQAAASPGWWQGPELPSDVSYRIAIDIHADGWVTHRYCIKPCKLPSQAKGLLP